MLRGIAAIVVALTLGVAPAAAANVSGWYAGIYAGGSARNDAELSYDLFGAFLDGPGAYEHPTSFINDGIDPFLFEGLNLGVLQVPFAGGLPGPGTAGGFLTDGTLSFLGAPAVGLFVGYGLGNGVRLEGELSAMGFVSDLFQETAITAVAVDGVMDGAGVWTWSDDGSLAFPPFPTPYPLEDTGFTYRTDVQFLLLSGYYDFDTGTAMSPYLGAGAGLARVSATVTDLCGCFGATSASTFVPAGQLGAGVRVAITDPVSLDLGYRLKLAASPEIGLYMIDTSLLPAFGVYGFGLSGVIAVHTLQAGLTVALQ